MKVKPIQHDIPGKQWESVGTDIFMLNNKTYLCIVDYHRKLPIIKLTDGLSADNLIKTCKVIFAGYWLQEI